MRTNRISRLVCVLLACLMLLPIVACGKTEGDASTTTTAVDGTAATTTAAQVVEDFWGEDLTADMDAEEAYQVIRDRILELNPEAQEKNIKKFILG